MSWNRGSNNDVISRCERIYSHSAAVNYWNRTPLNTRSSYWSKLPDKRPLTPKLRDQTCWIQAFPDGSYGLGLYSTILLRFFKPEGDEQRVEFGYNGGHHASPSTLAFLNQHRWYGRQLTTTDGHEVRIVPGSAGWVTMVNGRVDLSRSRNGRYYTHFTHPDTVKKRKVWREKLWPYAMTAALAAQKPAHWVGDTGAVVGALLLQWERNEDLTDTERYRFQEKLHGLAERVLFDSVKPLTDLELAKALTERAINNAWPTAKDRLLQPEWPACLPSRYWYTTNPDGFEPGCRAPGA